MSKKLSLIVPVALVIATLIFLLSYLGQDGILDKQDGVFIVGIPFLILLATGGAIGRMFISFYKKISKMILREKREKREQS